MERVANSLMGTLLAIAAILIMGPGGSSIMAQYAARQALGLVTPNFKRVPREREVSTLSGHSLGR
jgi:hypothetical protein